jgi:5-methylcytosine-specific restriction protein A
VTHPLYSTYRWQRLRAIAKRRDGYCCTACGRSGKLDVDHIEPINQRPDLAFALENLRTLCRPCHNRRTFGKRQSNAASRLRRRNSRAW